MRHLLSIVLALVLAPVIYLAAGFGLIHWTQAIASQGDSQELAKGLGGLGVAGALYAVLLLTRLSPLGPALVGALFVGLGVWTALDPQYVGDLLDVEIFGEQNLARAPVALVVPLGVTLLGTLFALNRWRAKVPAMVAESPYPTPNFPPPVPQPSTPSAYAQQYGTAGYGANYGANPYGAPDPVSPSGMRGGDPRRDETPATAVFPSAGGSSWPPADETPTLPSAPPSSSGGSSWPQPPSAPSWSQPPAGQSWSQAQQGQQPQQPGGDTWSAPPTEPIRTDRGWPESDRR